ncbi:uncharacterized protein METZ01_LOCUS362925, partial [marine metagenome]
AGNDHRNRLNHSDCGAVVLEYGRSTGRRFHMVWNRDRDRCGDWPVNPTARYILFHHQEHHPRPVDHSVSHFQGCVPVCLCHAASTHRHHRVSLAEPRSPL